MWKAVPIFAMRPFQNLEDQILSLSPRMVLGAPKIPSQPTKNQAAVFSAVSV
jgi:hypothetical protein